MRAAAGTADGVLTLETLRRLRIDLPRVLDVVGPHQENAEGAPATALDTAG